MKTISTLLLLFACIYANAQSATKAVTNAACINPVNLFAENITTNSALLTWKRYDKSALSFNLIWREYTAKSKWDTVFNIQDTNYLLKNLKLNTQYVFRVASVCSDTISRYKLKWVFSTLAKGGYCAAHSNSLIYIESVRFKNKKNTSGNNGSGYGDYTNIIVPFTKQKNYTLYVKPVKSPLINDSVTVSIYIDFNKNKLLSDAGELIGRKKTLGEKELPFSFIIPANAVNGNTRMRIVTEETFFAYNEPCNYTNGETEDYSVKITALSSANDDNAVMMTNKEISNLVVHPNPAGNAATVSCSIENTGNIELMIVDQSGRIRLSEKKGIQVKGKFNTQLNTTNIPDGNYILVLIKNGSITERTILVIRH
ncbi:GEVED domain-containing protein [Parafilimonas terrae]|uniref:Por secretion system C-terminal sorting domain-containing protein n=1 Tax=Parafilimonas terrae TaxID=1465490 RepID=A0A1I5TK04_9BACT|nr:GEVED domain-containing protein [Parafilimonas terrae]SFP83353.1 Por secretion system C-terminal sorting domain-containing protein [Parafilimonas terrae]